MLCMMSIEIRNICLLFRVFLTMNKIRLPNVMVSHRKPPPILIFMIYMGGPRQMSSAIVFWNKGTNTICISTIVFFHVEWVVQTVFLQDACHRHWSCYTTFAEYRQTLCAIVYEIKLHIPIETVVLFLS